MYHQNTKGKEPAVQLQALDVDLNPNGSLILSVVLRILYCTISINALIISTAHQASPPCRAVHHAAEREPCHRDCMWVSDKPQSCHHCCPCKGTMNLVIVLPAFRFLKPSSTPSSFARFCVLGATLEYHPQSIKSYMAISARHSLQSV